MTMNVTLDEREVLEEAAHRWWIFLVSGIAWLVFALIVFQWDYTTVYAISILFGIVALFAGVNEFLRSPSRPPDGRSRTVSSASSSCSPGSGRSCIRTTRSRRWRR